MAYKYDLYELKIHMFESSDYEIAHVCDIHCRRNVHGGTRWHVGGLGHNRRWMEVQDKMEVNRYVLYVCLMYVVYVCLACIPYVYTLSS